MTRPSPCSSSRVLAPKSATSASTSRISTAGPTALRVERFVEHYVRVDERSHDGRHPASSLGWTAAGARPADETERGLVPDALIPVAAAPRWAPYPLEIPAHAMRAVWLDVTIPRDARAGRRSGALVIRQSGAAIARIPIEVDVADATLPYRPVSFFAYYGRGALERRNGAAAERGLFQMLHAHRVDALPAVNEPGDVERLAPMLDGSLFTKQNGYEGPGERVPPALVALGTYGHIGEPTPAHVAFVRDALTKIPRAIPEVVFYAADEDCDEVTSAAWRQAFKGSPEFSRVKILHSCSHDPRKQDVDVVMMTADGFMTDAAIEARKSGREVWVYNGALPRSGSLLLDTGVTSLRADGWIAASRPVGRWFFWETTFYDDDNSGGRGPIDPFATAASFHNKHGDVALLDGILVYPGDQRDRFGEHALHLPGVLPSMRLKNLRRGAQDAGIYALARAAHPKEADTIVDVAFPAALDEVKETARTAFALDAKSLDEARDRLRALVANGAAPSSEESAKVLEAGAAERHARFARSRTITRGAMTGGGVAGALLFGGVWIALARARSRRARSRQDSR